MPTTTIEVVQAQVAWRKYVGIALLWVALAALVYVPASTVGVQAMLVAALGFGCFTAGLLLLGDALKREIVAELRRTDRSA